MTCGIHCGAQQIDAHGVQPGYCCCPPGQTGVIYGCSPFCVEGKYLDTNTGLCTPIALPPPQQ